MAPDWVQAIKQLDRSCSENNTAYGILDPESMLIRGKQVALVKDKNHKQHLNDH
jgi:hypothetical protein